MWWECKLVHLLWKTVWNRLKKLKIKLPYDPTILLLGIYPKECKLAYRKGTCITKFIAALFTIANLWKQPTCHITDEWIKKMHYLHTMEFYFATNAGKWMELENIILSEVNWVQKTKNSMFFHRPNINTAIL
jgi:hypothetical protein